jgi:hypothetical protein
LIILKVIYVLFLILKIIVQRCFVKLTRGTASDSNAEEGCGNNRSVMPLDVPGCTRATMIVAESIYQVDFALYPLFI